MSNNEIEKLTAIAVLHDHVKFFFGFDDFIKLNDIRMPDFFQDFDFSCNSFDILLIMNFVFLKDFNCDLY